MKITWRCNFIHMISGYSQHSFICIKSARFLSLKHHGKLTHEIMCNECEFFSEWYFASSMSLNSHGSLEDEITQIHKGSVDQSVLQIFIWNHHSAYYMCCTQLFFIPLAKGTRDIVFWGCPFFHSSVQSLLTYHLKKESNIHKIVLDSLEFD